MPHSAGNITGVAAHLTWRELHEQSARTICTNKEMSLTIEAYVSFNVITLVPGRSFVTSLAHGHFECQSLCRDDMCVCGAVNGYASCVVSLCGVCAFVRTAMAGWLHGVCVGAC